MATATAERKTTVMEEHFTVKELAQAWKLSEDTVWRMVRDEPGVFKINVRPSGRLLTRKGQGPARFSLRIPASVAQRIHDQRSA